MHPQILDNMLQNIPDPAVRQQYADIMAGKVSAIVHCNSPTCKGRIIAEILTDSKGVRETPPVLGKKKGDNVYTSGLESSRMRLDGQWGFRCYCGNNSILAEHEKGVITANAPTKRDLEKIFGKLADNPSVYITKKGITAVDGFTIEEIS